MQNPVHYHGFDFIMLAPLELNAVYKIIAPGLDIIQRKTAVDWDLNDLPIQISANLATLIMIYQDKRYAGFMVTRHRYHGAPTKHYLEVVAMYVDKWIIEDHQDVMPGADEWLMEYAREFACHAVYQRSTRMGWAKRLEKQGYTVREIMVMKEV